MSPQARALPAAPMMPTRWVLAALLAAALFLAGMEVEAVFAALTQLWQVIFRGVGLAGILAHWQQGTSQLYSPRSGLRK